jgi:hypothetical protein
MIFALVIERDPLRWADVLGGVLAWAQAVGGFALFGLVLWLLLGLPQMHPRDRAAIPRRQFLLFAGALGLSVICYVAFALLSLGVPDIPHPDQPPTRLEVLRTYVGALGGFLAFLAASLPFLLSLARFSARRIYALARLSFKEAIRRRILYAFAFALLLYLFAAWFVPSKPESQVRTYVVAFSWGTSILLLFVACLLSAFSIPADIKQQTIHTIVTKPVERFEVVLGRFLGFLALMSLVLVAMTLLSLVFVLRGVNPEAAAESLKAREPLYGELRFENAESEKKSINVGREWDYRSYITRPNPGQEPQTARWDFATVPAALGGRKQVTTEYTFDVYRTTKGDEGRDVTCSFKFYTWRFRRGNDETFRKEKAAGGGSPERDSDLAEKLGYYEINSLPVTDYHTQQFTLPGGLFRNAAGADPERTEELRSINQPRPADLIVRVTSDSPTQYVGMAKYDLYVRLDDSGRSEAVLFALNFIKAAFGLWLRLALIIGLAVILSTYLSGVISLLVTLLLFLGGLSKDFIHEVALGTNVGGGPLEAMVRISRREMVSPNALDAGTAGDFLVSRSDAGFRWLVGRILNIIPDVDRYNMTSYVAEGFNISTEQMVLSLLLLVGYLLPWMVLAYYLMKWREVANPN